MKKHWQGNFLYYLGGIVLTLFLCVGLIHMVSEEKENKSFEKTAQKEVKEEQTTKSDQTERTDIRVLLKTEGYVEETHAKVEVSAPGGLLMEGAEGSKETKEGETVVIQPDDQLFNGGTISIRPKKEGEKITISSIRRGYGVPSYRGSLELFSTAQGIVVINELPLEEYLYAVVPSEMPVSYELEALKVQAVCARSYAYCHMEGEAYPEYKANVDDSTAFQVYGNSSEQEKTIEAVDATKGEKLKYNGKVVKAYYFSTSCGKTTDVGAWGTQVTKDNEYLKSTKVEENGEYYEKELPWFSWSCDIPVETLSNLFGLNTGQDVGSVSEIEITKRGSGDIALEMKVSGSKGKAVIKTENKIRSALGGEGYEIRKQDGTTVSSSTLLPSAFFTVEKDGDLFHIEGGGYGHGIGMSQNGANEMAKKGKDYKTILQMFYNGVEITSD